MAHRNHFDLLSSSQEPSQLIAQATNTAKNRKKKEKSKGKKAASVAEPVDSQPARDRNDKESQARTVQQIQAAPVHHSEDFEALQRRFTKDAQNSDCWSVWTEWLRRVRKAALPRRQRRVARIMIALRLQKSSSVFFVMSGNVYDPDLCT